MNHPLISQKQNLKIEGEVTVPGDKSISHRSLIFSSLAKGSSKITGLLEGEDVLKTAEALKKMGVEITKNNEVWIGNAAQTLHPVAGQGLNLGLRDAFLLAEKLVGVFAGSPENQTPLKIQEALETYAQSRKVDRTTTIGLTDFMARVFTSNLIPIVMARGLALSALQWLPPVKTALARQMMFGRR